MVLKGGQNLVIEYIRHGHRNFGRIDLGKRHRRIRVNDSLLINPAHSLQILYIKGILTEEITRMLGLYLIRMRLPLLLRCLQGYKLGFCLNNPFLGRLLLQ